MARSVLWRRILAVLVLGLSASPSAFAACGQCAGAALPAFLCSLTETVPPVEGCSGLPSCQQPVIDSTRIDVIPQGDGTFEARLVAHVKAPGNLSHPFSFLKLKLFWNNSGTATHPTTTFCQHETSDAAETYLAYSGLTCSGAPYDLGVFSLRAVVCDGGGTCQRIADQNGLSLQVTRQTLGCVDPPVWGCDGDGGCTYCLQARGGAGSPAGEGASAEPAGSGPGARLRYRAGGAGGPGLPGSAAWNTILGRYWAHDYSERIVPDPDVGHVWFITKSATFREFTDADADGVYETVAPSDEKRRLMKTAAGWELRDLLGTVDFFDNAGLWQSTTDRHGNAKMAIYTGGVLSRVNFPDGRHEDFAYLGGKLRTITDVGVGGAASRTWTYTWTGDDLIRIDRPDGTAWEFFYSSNPNLGGYLTRMDLRGTTPGTGRVDSAWEYDAQGNVVRLWRGDLSFTGPNAIEKWSFSHDNPMLPTRTEVTDALGRVSVYTIGRDISSGKPRIERLAGDCPTCGSGPNSVYTFGDSQNPLRPTVIVDGRGLRTEFTYNSNGKVTRKLEAVGTPLQRDTNWQYHATWPALVTQVDVPSTSGGAARRETLTTYNAQGDPVTDSVQGAESGSFFSYATATTFNAGGQPLTVDRPGHGTADVTAFTYDPTRGNGRLILQTRTDPLIGTTLYSHDAYNRQTEMTDPNGVKTITAYDALDRVTSTIQQGDPGAGTPDLVTTHTYNEFGDLFRTILPEGNVIEYGYDAAGRLISMERKPNAAARGERMFYTLDGAGHRTREELQRWTGSAWVAESWTDFVYSTRCHLDKVIHPDGTSTGAVTEYAYDCNGNVERVWDPNHPRASNPNPTQLYAYDQLNRLSSLTQPWTGAGGGSAVTLYGYDVQDHLTSVTDAEGNVTTYTYSDRDLMTGQISPVSGTSTYSYNEHGELATETDARNIFMTRTTDELDRVTLVSYPDATLNTTYTYDQGAFGKGRLAGITRHGETISYTYDRFGRLLQDGDLAYTWDKNGNRRTITYPGAVTATYSHDFADREMTLAVQVGANPPVQLVSTASYEPFGPLKTLVLGNGLTETRTFDDRYTPSEIRVDGTGIVLRWSYTTDPVGNITAIGDLLNAANNRSYGYQDILYFLTQGNGPWGPRSWSYDKIGNRLTETRGATTDTYTYITNGTGGHTARIDQIILGAGSPITYSYDPVGNVLENGILPFSYGDDRRTSRLGTSWPNTTYTHDGRGYLSRSTFTPAVNARTDDTLPTYSSDGLLYHRHAHDSLEPESRLDPVKDSDLSIFYLAGRPVATLDQVTQGSPSGGFTMTSNLQYLTVDHLGTPILATNTAGAQVWQGGFDPFGADYSSAPTVLRFPGQWFDATWNGGKDLGLYYNVNRWFNPGVGSYSQPDPLVFIAPHAAYRYALSNPVRFIDMLGLQVPLPQPTPTEPWPPIRLLPPPPPPTCKPSLLGAIGRGMAAAGGAITVILNELFNPSPAGEQGLSDFTDPSCKPKCGDCDPVEHGFLQAAVNRACKSGPRKCIPGMSPSELKGNFFKNAECYYARQEVNSRCYRGGDPDHRGAAADTARATKKCADLMMRPGRRTP